MSALSRPRHPGLPAWPRRLSARATGVRELLLPIAAGDELFAFARRFAASTGGGAAAMLNFDALAMRPIALHVPEPDPSARQIMRYGLATVIEAGCELVSAQMSVGGTATAPVLHGHGQVRRADGSGFGGHLADGGCFAARPSTVRCTVFDGLRLTPSFDAETGFSLLDPVRADDAEDADEGTSAPASDPANAAAHGSVTGAASHAANELANGLANRSANDSVNGLPTAAAAAAAAAATAAAAAIDAGAAAATGAVTAADADAAAAADAADAAAAADAAPAVPAADAPRAGWLLRLKPDEDLVGALADLARAERIVRPVVVGGVGSLMHATLASADGARCFVDGPGVEIVTLRGEGQALEVVVADLAGNLHAGRPLPGGNPICVTIELFVVEAA